MGQGGTAVASAFSASRGDGSANPRSFTDCDAAGHTSAASRPDQLQLALVNALMHTKGHAAPETIASLDRARAFIEQAESLGESPEDPLLLFSVLYGFWVANYIGFNS